MLKKVDIRVERTVTLIRKAFIDLLHEQEYDKISVQEISKVAGINRVTFYSHYFDKEDLLEQIMHDTLEELKESIIVPEDEFQYEFDQPVPTFIRLYNHILKNKELYKILLVDKRMPEFNQEIHGLIKKSVRNAIEYYQAEGFKLKVPNEVIVAYMSSAYFGVIVWWLEEDMPYSPEYLSSLLTQMATVGAFIENPFDYQKK